MNYEYECEECNGKGIDLGSLYRPEPCTICDGSGRITTECEIGDVIEYRDDEHQLRTATIIDLAGVDGWVRIHDEGSTWDTASPEYDEPDLDVRAIVRVMPWDEYLNLTRLRSFRSPGFRCCGLFGILGTPLFPARLIQCLRDFRAFRFGCPLPPMAHDLFRGPAE